MNIVRQFGVHALQIYWERRSYRTAIALGAVTSLVSLVQFLVMGKFLQEGNTFAGIEGYGGNIISFLMSGSVFTGFVAVSLGAFSSHLQTEQRTGTLESVVVMPVPLTRVMMYSGIVGLIGTTFGSVVMFGVFGAIFDIPISVNLLATVAVLALLVITLGSFGLAGCGVLLITKRGDPVRWGLTTLTTLLSGVMYPVSILPGWLQSVAQALPTTQALDGIRKSLLVDADLGQVAPSLVHMAIWAVVMLPVGVVTFAAGMSRARRAGSIGEY
ncbi:ABC transporter permease [Streptomyces sp. DSM 41527]|uniref:Transport permease protein n=1 Tax=Streptomyces mooreae TaxID=3075523 RepID=A0ABU2TFN1_9ACTN|nr:ABC transporter permease [Streptomyces sp. DSM 41527]MDT0459737.1 ABC transporter permease [Streptomyces sp. DSM 41527]